MGSIFFVGAVIAFCLMLVAFVCVAGILSIVRSVIRDLRTTNAEHYRRFFSESTARWIENESYAWRSGTQAWWEIARQLYFGEAVCSSLRSIYHRRFVLYVRALLVSLPAALLLTTGIVASGFVLATAQ